MLSEHADAMSAVSPGTGTPADSTPTSANRAA